MIGNLPSTLQSSNATAVKQFFDNQTNNQLTFPAAEIDAVIGFFVKRGFDQSSASSTAIILLTQARAENVSVFTLVDKLKGVTDVQLTQVIAQVLNAYREKTSLLGYKTEIQTDTFESRNILI